MNNDHRYTPVGYPAADSALNKESQVRRVIIWYDERGQEIFRNEITPGGRNGLPWGAWYWKVEDIHAD